MKKRLLFSATLLLFPLCVAAQASQNQPQPKDDETLVYGQPDAPLTLKQGDPHPTVSGWHFFTANEFQPRSKNDRRPKGFVERFNRMMSRTARIDNQRCSEVTDGVLKMITVEWPDSIDNRFGKKVKYSHACYQSAPLHSRDGWCTFTENMRIEIRYRRSDTQGFNNALWFMNNSRKPWPKGGEIDLVENPKKQVNQKVHFTLHSENHYAGVMGGGGSTTASIELDDLTRWNIFWIEWYPDRIVGGVNGQPYFEHLKGANGNTDWPWSDPEGFYLIISTGISDDPNRWPGAVDPSQWDAANPPSMEVDWVRVYTNSDYKGPKAKNIYY